MSEEEANARLAYGSAVTISPRSIKSAAAKVAAEPSSGDKSDTRCAIVSVASVSRKIVLTAERDGLCLDQLWRDSLLAAFLNQPSSSLRESRIQLLVVV